MGEQITGPKAPKDPTKKRPGFYIMRHKAIAGSPQPDGTGCQFIYEDCGRLPTSAKLVGNIEDEEILKLMPTTEGFRKLVHSIGVTVEVDGSEAPVTFALQMYGHKDVYGSGTYISREIPSDGMEQLIVLDEVDWSDDDNVVGQIRFIFEKAGLLGKTSVKLYLNDGFTAPPEEDDEPVDRNSDKYKEMIAKSLMKKGNNIRIKKALDKARRGEDVTVGFIGGSITQGAGAIPINTECYTYKTFKGFCDLAGKGYDENIHYVKAGVGGTPSELGMLRYDRDVCDEGRISPDLVVVEFAVNDAGDETGGECFDSLVRKIYNSPQKPAVIIIFAVFADGFNLQERLACVGEAYDIPMVSIKDAVYNQFSLRAATGRVVAKSQYFYDSYHPTNVGHDIMSDGIINLLKVCDSEEYDKEEVDITTITPPKGGEFEKVILLDKHTDQLDAVIDCGDFTDTDTVIQCVERNMDLFTTPEFPYNWMYRGIEGRNNKPFEMSVTCSALVVMFKDSASNDDGTAEVYVDGEKVYEANPREVGWTHCNHKIVLRGAELKKHSVRIQMKSGFEDKNFTILGFGIVK